MLSKSEVQKMVGLSGPTIWRMERKGEFPARRQISANRVAWLDTEIEEWLRSRPTVRPQDREAA
jgi:prophage regulatory protein